MSVAEPTPQRRPPHARSHNRILRQAERRAEALEPQLAEVLRGIIVDAAHVAAGNFRAFATDHEGLTAAAAEPFCLPAELRTKTDPVRLALIETVGRASLESAGIAWDVTNPFFQRVVVNSGKQITNVAQTVQHDVMRVIKASYENGLSIPDTAKAIQTVMTDDAFTRATLIARCLPPDALVDGAVVRAVTRRWYEGDMTVLVTESGCEFAATPNHPMLTRLGWRSAGEVNEGDYLLRYGGHQDAGAARDEHPARPPATIAEVFRTASAVGVVRRGRGGEPDFHGDGRDGEVDIATPDRPLRLGTFAPIFEHLSEEIFAPSDEPIGARFCSRCGHLLAVDKSACLCGASGSDARFAEYASDEGVGVAERTTDGLDSLSAREHAQHRVNVGAVVASGGAPSVREEVGSRGLHRPRLGTGLAYPSKNGALIDGEGLSDVRGAAAGEVIADRVVARRTVEYAGYVFNLVTPYGYFTVNGGYTGNTELTGAVNGASLASMQVVSDVLGDGAGGTGAAYEKAWMTAEGAMFPRHETYDGLDGQTVGLDEAFDVGGEPLMYPGDPDGDVSEVANCRCSMEYVDQEGDTVGDQVESLEAAASACRFHAGVKTLDVDAEVRALYSSMTAAGPAGWSSPAPSEILNVSCEVPGGALAAVEPPPPAPAPLTPRVAPGPEGQAVRGAYNVADLPPYARRDVGTMSAEEARAERKKLMVLKHSLKQRARVAGQAGKADLKADLERRAAATESRMAELDARVNGAPPAPPAPVMPMQKILHEGESVTRMTAGHDLDAIDEEIVAWENEDAVDVAGAAIQSVRDGSADELRVVRNKDGSVSAVAAVSHGPENVIVEDIASSGGGAGTRLLRQIADDAGSSGRNLRLLATPDATPYYEHLGFPRDPEAARNAFKLTPEQARDFAARGSLNPAPPSAPVVTPRAYDLGDLPPYARRPAAELTPVEAAAERKKLVALKGSLRQRMKNAPHKQADYERRIAATDERIKELEDRVAGRIEGVQKASQKKLGSSSFDTASGFEKTKQIGGGHAFPAYFGKAKLADGSTIDVVIKPRAMEEMRPSIDDAEPEREAAASIIADAFASTDAEFAVVTPETVVMPDGSGSVQERFMDLKPVYDPGRWSESPLKPFTDREISNASLFDIVIGNQDRHMGNIGYSGTNHALTLFDHGLSFPHAVTSADRAMAEDLGMPPVWIRSQIALEHYRRVAVAGRRLRMGAVTKEEVAFLKKLYARRQEIDAAMETAFAKSPAEARAEMRDAVNEMWNRAQNLIKDGKIEVTITG